MTGAGVSPGRSSWSSRALRPGRRLVVEVQQVVDVRDERRGLLRADGEQHLAARDEQLVAQLQRFGEIRVGHGPGRYEGDRRSPSPGAPCAKRPVSSIGCGVTGPLAPAGTSKE